MTKIKAMRPKDWRKLPKEHDYLLFYLFRRNCYSLYSVNSAPDRRMDEILFRFFFTGSNQNRSQKNTIPANSHNSRVFSFRNSPKRTCLKKQSERANGLVCTNSGYSEFKVANQSARKALFCQ